MVEKSWSNCLLNFVLKFLDLGLKITDVLQKLKDILSFLEGISLILLADLGELDITAKLFQALTEITQQAYSTLKGTMNATKLGEFKDCPVIGKVLDNMFPAIDKLESKLSELAMKTSLLNLATGKNDSLNAGLIELKKGLRDFIDKLDSAISQYQNKVNDNEWWKEQLKYIMGLS
jgi:hypothetical protein